MREKVLKMLEEETGEAVTPETTFESLKMDSLEFVNLMLATESEFDIKISDEEMQPLLTAGDLVKLVEEKTA